MLQNLQLPPDKTQSISRLSIFHQAIARLCVWKVGMDGASLLDNGMFINNQAKLLQKWKIGTLEDNIQSLQTTPLENVYNHLIQGTDVSQYSSDFSKFLNYLRDETLDPTSPKNWKDRNRYIIKQIYYWHHQDFTTTASILALFDVFVSLITPNNINNNINKSIISLYHDVFDDVSRGLNCWILHRSWADTIIRCESPEDTKEFEEKYSEYESNRKAIADQLIKEMIESPTLSPHIEGVLLYARSLGGLMRSSLLAQEKYQATFLKVICKTEDDCYLIEAWLEKRGEIHRRLTRKSLGYPERNGARRFQIGLGLKDHNTLFIARIGDRDSHQSNSWGYLLRLYEDRYQPEHSNLEDKLPLMVKIYEITGAAISIPESMTLQDYLFARFPHKYPYYVTNYVNSETLELDEELRQGDVIDIRINPELYPNPNIVRNRSTQTAVQISDQSLEVFGKNRLQLMLKEYLQPWDIELSLAELAFFMKKFGYISEDSGEGFARFATDHSEDLSICKLAVQLYLKGQIRPTDVQQDNQMPSWRYIEIAQCCRPTQKHSIVGTVKTPETPSQKPFWRVHRADCPKGPRKNHNRINLTWVKDNHEATGMKITIELPNSDGILAQIMRFLNNETDIDVVYVSADAINFKSNAFVTIKAIAKTAYGYEYAKDAISREYNNFKLLIHQMSRADLLMITDTNKHNPFSIASESFIDSDLPIRCIGRGAEIQKIISSLNSPYDSLICILGYYRVGKTWLCIDAIQQLRETNNWLPIYIDCRTIERQKVGNPLGDIVWAIHRQVRNFVIEFGYPLASNILNDPFPKNLETLSQWLNKVASEYHVVIFLDEFSTFTRWCHEGYLSSKHLASLRNFFMKRTNRTNYKINYVLVFQLASHTQLTELSDYLLDEQLYRHAHQLINIKPFSAEIIKELIHHPLQEYSYSDEAAKFIFELSGGIAYTATILAREIWNRLSRREHIDSVSLADVEGIVHEMFAEASWGDYSSHSLKQLKDDVLKLLQYLAVVERDQGNGMWSTVDALSIPYLTSTETELAIRNLEEAGLVMKLPDGEHMQIRGRLLSMYLANTNLETLRKEAKLQ